MKYKIPTTILISATAIGFAATTFRAIRLIGIGVAMVGTTFYHLTKKKHAKSSTTTKLAEPYANQQP